MHAALLSDAQRKQRETFIAQCCLRGVLATITEDDVGNALVILSRGVRTDAYASLDAAEAGLQTFEKEDSYV
jgi:hypothetical protein